MAMTVERYLTVCHPFYHHSHSWPTRCYVLPILVFSIFYNVPRFFELETKFKDSEDNSTSTAIQQPSFNGTDFVSMTNVSAEEPSNFTSGFYLQPTKFRLNYYYYTIYLVSFLERWDNFSLNPLWCYLRINFVVDLIINYIKPDVAQKAVRKHYLCPEKIL